MVVALAADAAPGHGGTAAATACGTADYGSRPQTIKDDKTDYLGRHFSDWIEVEVVSIAQLLQGEDIWDLVHIDVQGWEVDLCTAAAGSLSERVKWLVVGTHDAKLHGDLIGLMFECKWALENEKPPRFAWTGGAPTLAAMTTHDGTQVWRNPKLVE
jgi:hypothetical protein